MKLWSGWWAGVFPTDLSVSLAQLHAGGQRVAWSHSRLNASAGAAGQRGKHAGQHSNAPLGQPPLQSLGIADGSGTRPVCAMTGGGGSRRVSRWWRSVGAAAETGVCMPPPGCGLCRTHAAEGGCRRCIPVIKGQRKSDAALAGVQRVSVGLMRRGGAQRCIAEMPCIRRIACGTHGSGLRRERPWAMDLYHEPRLSSVQ